MKKYLLFLIIYFPLKNFAQNGFCDTCKSVTISICPTEMLAGYETMYLDYKFSKHFSFGIGAGHIFPFAHRIISADEPEWAAYNGTIFRANFKYCFGKGLYIALLATYKNLYYSWQDFKNTCQGAGADAGLYYFTKSENASVHGIGLLFGYQKKVSKYFVLNFFIGIGENSKNRDYTIYTVTDHCHSGSIDPLPIPGNYTEQSKLDSFPLGIKLAYTIHEKK